MKAERRGFGRAAWIALACGAAVITLAFGIRAVFGLFLRPISADLDIGRQVFGLAIAIQTIITGFGNPVFGGLADRFGAGRVIVFGAMVYALGLVLAASSASPLGLYLTFGVLIGIAMSAASMSVVLGAIARRVPAEKRSLAFGIVTAGGSVGQFACIPFAQLLIDAAGWRMALIGLAVLAAFMIALAFGVRGRSEAATGPSNEAASLGAALREASVHPGYWMLNGGFFVCGFHVALIATHLPSFLVDRGISPQVAAQSLAFVGLFNIFGSFLSGWLGGHLRKRYILAFIYAARALIFVPLILLPMTPFLALLFSAAMGFLYLSTVPLTSGLVAQVFGAKYFSTLFGVVFLSHQIGGFLGAWLGGYFYDLTGSYDFVWWMSVALGIIAAVLSAPTPDRPLVRAVPAVA